MWIFIILLFSLFFPCSRSFFVEKYVPPPEPEISPPPPESSSESDSDYGEEVRPKPLFKVIKGFIC